MSPDARDELYLAEAAARSEDPYMRFWDRRHDPTNGSDGTGSDGTGTIRVVLTRQGVDYLLHNMNMTPTDEGIVRVEPTNPFFTHGHDALAREFTRSNDALARKEVLSIDEIYDLVAGAGVPAQELAAMDNAVASLEGLGVIPHRKESPYNANQEILARARRPTIRLPPGGFDPLYDDGSLGGDE